MSRACHHCGFAIGATERPGRRDTCLGCGSDLHCCLNCSFHEVGYHNECRETQAERQVDKARGNFCEYFTCAERTAPAPARNAARDALQGLFSDKRPHAGGVAPAPPPSERAAHSHARKGRS